MPTASLNNFGVVGVGDTDGALLMPKLQYRYRVTLTKFGSDSDGSGDSTYLTQQVIDVSKPNVSFDDITLDTYNSRIYLAGKTTWEPITLNVRDDITNKVQNAVGEQLQKQFDFFEQSSAAAGGDYKFTLVLNVLDGGKGNGENAYHKPEELEAFTLMGCWIESASYNSLNYAESGPQTISLTICYDNAVQTDKARKGAGIGSALSSAINTYTTDPNTGQTTFSTTSTGLSTGVSAGP